MATGWLPWDGPGHFLFWLALALLLEVIAHNAQRWWANNH